MFDRNPSKQQNVIKARTTIEVLTNAIYKQPACLLWKLILI